MRLKEKHEREGPSKAGKTLMLNNQLIGADHEQFLDYWRELAVFGQSHHSNATEVYADAAGGEVHNLEYQRSALGESEPTSLGPISPKLKKSKIPTDYSFVLLEKGRPTLGCSLALTVEPDGKRKLGCGDGLATTYLNSRALDTQSHNISADSLAQVSRHLRTLIAELNPDVIEFRDTLRFGLLSPLTQALIVSGGLPVVSCSLIVDLTDSDRVRMKNIASLVRCHIQQAQRDYEFIAQIPPIIYSNPQEEFMNLAHSLEPKKSIGFKVEAMKCERLVAAAQFSCKQDHCRLESIKTSNESIDKQLMFGLLWSAQTHARAAGFSYLQMDRRFQELSTDECRFDHVGGVETTEMTVTLHRQPKR
ncbi:MAG: hypothetical protein AB8B95_00650 [Pseudohongiellaceae bacterium]